MSGNPSQGRKTNAEEPKMLMRDQAVPWTWYPLDQPMEKYGQGALQWLMLEHTLNEELQDKYMAKYRGSFKSYIEVGSVPKCFNTCVTSLDEVALSPDEKN
mmetsp:Transcript_1658/g.1460  ORF Transcript_1658/g.1460 Transcript_1658/m.1460 type:complete len:101 (+) Transcript_1658:37-339(+)